MNISQENRVLAAVDRFEKMERDIAIKAASAAPPAPVPKKPKDLTPIELKNQKKAALEKEADAKEKAKKGKPEE